MGLWILYASKVHLKPNAFFPNTNRRWIFDARTHTHWMVKLPNMAELRRPAKESERTTGGDRQISFEFIYSPIVFGSFVCTFGTCVRCDYVYFVWCARATKYGARHDDGNGIEKTMGIVHLSLRGIRRFGVPFCSFSLSIHHTVVRLSHVYFGGVRATTTPK